MTRTLQAAALIGLALALGGLWFVSTHERVEIREWVGPSPAARVNPYLAAMRFAERLGMKTAFVYGTVQFEALPPDSVVLLPAGRSGLTAARLRALDRWLREGGHAIVEPEAAGKADLLLDRHRIKRDGSARAPAEKKSEIELPGIDRPLVAAYLPAPALRFEGTAPDIVAPDSGGIWLASIPIGAGRLTVVSGLRRFDNRSIGSHDHAEIFRRVLDFRPNARTLTVMRLPHALPLWGWLRDNALPTLAAGGVLLALWLLRILPRFGPIQPEPANARRQLREHILATGRFRWAHGGRAGLLGAARETCEHHVAALTPRLAQMPPERRWQELAARTGLEVASVAAAFGGPVRNAREFVHVIGTLASIHANISRPSGPRPARLPPP